MATSDAGTPGLVSRKTVPVSWVAMRVNGQGHGTWEQQVLSARGLKRVGRHSEYAICTVWRMVRKKRPGGLQASPLNPLYLFLPCVLEEGGPYLVDCMMVV